MPGTAQAEARRGLRAYIRLLANTGNPVAALVLREGRDFTRRATADTDLEYGPAKACFENACHVALRDRRWRYCEGYAIGGAAIPAHHAWLADADGRAVDITWRESGNECGLCDGDDECPLCDGTGHVPWEYDLSGAAYYGIEYDREHHANLLLLGGTYDVLGYAAADDAE